MTDHAPTLDQRIRPGRFPEIGVIAWLLSRAGGRLAHSEPMNLFLVLGRHRRLFRGWLYFAGRLMPGGLLPRAESELVILRVAHLRGSRYEQNQHERIGRRAGLSADDLARVRVGPHEPGWSTRQQAILTVVDELLDQRDVGDDAWAGLRQHLDEREAIELVLLAGHYDMLAAAIAALENRARDIAPMTTSTSARRLPSGRRSRATRSRDDVTTHQRDRMLGAMTACAAENGYGAVTVSAVIARAGVSRATFYEQFTDRQACFLAAFDRAVDLLLAELEQRVATSDVDALTGAASFDALVAAYLEALTANEALTRVLLIDVATLGAEGVLRRAASQQRISSRLAQVVGASTPEDEFACDTLVAAVGSLVTVRLAQGDLGGIRDLHGPVVELGARLFGSLSPTSKR